MQKLYKDISKQILDLISSFAKGDIVGQTYAKLPESIEYLLSGYLCKDPASLIKTFEAKEVNNDIIVFRSLPFSSLCQHHLLPMLGKINIGYLPKNKVVGISGVKRLVNAITKRLQLQEKICNQICTDLHNALLPHGVIVHVFAKHTCTMQEDDPVFMHTLHKTGIFKKDADQVKKFFDVINLKD